MLEIVKTADGSNTIYNPQVGENYHSKHGAVAESRHVFLNSGLVYFLDAQASSKSPPLDGGETLAATAVSFKVSPTGGDLEGARVSILEVGFGTGLNFLLSADFCTDKGITLDYTGIEAYPLSLEMISQTGYHQYVSEELWRQFIINYGTNLLLPVKLLPCCQLQIANCKLSDFQSEKQYDIIYFDAFAANYQPEMWDETAISHTVHFLKPGGVFVTYAITGNLKRSLKALGCNIEKAPGAPGKREMLRAVKMITD
ncbi:MAG TPA: tRNA (5-methylaminomethyl-2-thiouridine)(34)-methyltransferase MnmD [Mucilaginibacter sp.]|jgi:tRNA U34 5-methylaminomethyl-2-thiouridine-forming methyltransferase MnmC